MASKRLNSTAALATRPLDGNVHHSISTRKIANGYLIETSMCNDRTGEYQHSTTFSEREPRIEPGRALRSPSPDAGGGLAGAMEYLKR